MKSAAQFGLKKQVPAPGTWSRWKRRIAGSLVRAARFPMQN